MGRNPERYLVIGGAGFLGSYIVQGLVDREESGVAAFDLKEPLEHDRIPGVVYYTGDICDHESFCTVLKQTRATTVFHTASPVHGSPDFVQQRVNVDGTRTVIEACRDPYSGGTVSKLVYTSSTGVVWDATDFNGVSEDEVVYPVKGYDVYHHTKAVAEKMVLAANGDSIWTTVIRPCGMIGPRDRQLLHRLATVLENKQHKVQIGDNTNLVDWAYVGNVADAHILASDRLPSGTQETVEPCGQPVAGQAFFVTNGTPIPQWDFSRMVWRALGAPEEDTQPENVIKIPRWSALCLAFFTETWCRMTGRNTDFTVFAIRYVTATQWYNIEKAREHLGYRPRITLEEAVQVSARWWLEGGALQHS